jgi:hypothetical protein
MPSERSLDEAALQSTLAQMRSALRIAIVTAAAVSLANSSDAQRPNLSGVWVRNDSVPGRTVATAGDAAFRTGDMGSGWGTPLTLTQTAEKLTVVFDFFIPYDLQPKARYTYEIGGAEVKNTINVGNAPVDVRSRTAWQGDTLEITSKFPVPPGVAPNPNAPDLVQRLWLDAQGRLKVEARRQGAGALVNSVLTTWTKR